MAHPCFSLWCAVALIGGRYANRDATSAGTLIPAFPDVEFQRTLQEVAAAKQMFEARPIQAPWTEKDPTQLELAAFRQGLKAEAAKQLILQSTMADKGRAKEGHRRDGKSKKRNSRKLLAKKAQKP